MKSLPPVGLGLSSDIPDPAGGIFICSQFCILYSTLWPYNKY